jgi:hypothetical protein
MRHMPIAAALMMVLLLSGCLVREPKSLNTSFGVADGRIKMIEGHPNNTFMGEEAVNLLGAHVSGLSNDALAAAGVRGNTFAGQVSYLRDADERDADGYWEVKYGDTVQYADTVQGAAKTLIDLNAKAGNFDDGNLAAAHSFINNYSGPSIEQQWQLTLAPIRQAAVEEYALEISRTPRLQQDGLLAQLDQRYHNAGQLFAGRAGGTPYPGFCQTVCVPAHSHHIKDGR